MQIRQNTRALKLGSLQSVVDNYQATLRLTAESESLAAIDRTGIIRFSDLTKEEQVRFNAVWACRVLQFQNTLRLFKSGVLDQSTFAAYDADMVSCLLSPGLSEWWRVVQHRYPPELRDHLNAALSVTEEVPPSLSGSIPFFREDTDRSGS